VLVLFALRELGTGETGYGVLLAAGGVGGVLGSLATPVLRRRVGAGLLLPATVVLVGVCQALIAVAPGVAVAGLLLAAYTAVDAVWSILSTSLRQELVPTELLGRVNAAYRTLGRGASPLGALAGGVLVAGAGVRAPFLVGAPILVLAGLAAWVSVNPRTVRAAALAGQETAARPGAAA
jgi:predicted MFS family arabinose efflux permease